MSAPRGVFIQRQRLVAITLSYMVIVHRQSDVGQSLTLKHGWSRLTSEVCSSNDLDCFRISRQSVTNFVEVVGRHFLVTRTQSSDIQKLRGALQSNALCN